jgi:hypothetical protein
MDNAIGGMQPTPDECARMDAEDQLLDDTSDGIDYEEIIADLEAERRGERPPAILIESREHFMALLDEAARRRNGGAR